MVRQLTNLPIRSVYISERKNMSFETDPILLICRRTLLLFYPTPSDLKQLGRQAWASEVSTSGMLAVSSRFTGNTFFRKPLSRKTIASILLKHTSDSLRKTCPDSRFSIPYSSLNCTVQYSDHKLQILSHDNIIFITTGQDCSALLTTLKACGFTDVQKAN